MGKSNTSNTSTYIIFSLILFGLSCSGPESDQPLLTAEVPLHLEDHIDDAKIEGSEVAENLLTPVEWRFNEPQPMWVPTKPIPKKMEAVKSAQSDDALRLSLTQRNRREGMPRLLGSIHVALPDWNLHDWAFVEIRARTKDPILRLGLDFNYVKRNPLGGSRAVLPLHTLPHQSIFPFQIQFSGRQETRRDRHRPQCS